MARTETDHRRDGRPPTGEAEETVSGTEADEMEEHLRGLGYLE